MIKSESGVTGTLLGGRVGKANQRKKKIGRYYSKYRSASKIRGEGGIDKGREVP